MSVKNDTSTLFEYLPIGAYRVGLDGRILQANRAFVRIHQCRDELQLTERLQACGFNPYVQPQRHKDLVDELHKHGKVSDFVSEMFRLQNGERFWVREHAHALYDRYGKVVAFEGTIEDITRERKARAALRKSEAMLRNVMQTIPDQIWVKDLQGVYLTCNGAFADALGVQIEDIVGTRDANWVEETIAAEFMLSDQWALQSGRTVSFEESNVTKINPDGLLFEVNKTPMRDAQGKVIGVLGVSRNIQDRKDAEALLRDTTEQLELAIMGAELGRWDHDLRHEPGYLMDQRAFAMLGHMPGDAQAPRSWSQFIHPDDLAHVAGAVHQHLQGQSASFQAEYRAQHASGRWIWLSSRGKIVQTSQDGIPQRMVGTLMDITNRKQAEQSLLAAQAELQATLDALPDLLFEFSSQGHYRAVHSHNKSALIQDPQMLIDRTVQEVLPQEAAAACMAAIEQASHNGRSDGVQYSLESASGRVWYELSVVRKPAVGNEETRFIAIARDITERKVAEEAIRHLAFHDALTSLPNRRLLNDRLQTAMAQSQRSAELGALLFIDLDRFKQLNDTRGHDVGDLLLQEVARRLQRNVRQVDTVARLGGDEFVVLLQNLGPDPGAARLHASMISYKILASLNEDFTLAGQSHKSTPSIGVTLFSGSRTQAAEALKNADTAMYAAKQRGRNNVCFYEDMPPAPANTAPTAIN
ncbi:diguanylate cyclase [Rhodoferax sp.]|uniref:diguanylate cyclase domain-containing protein n=1 Tax=Rhodoferax sp. TaxID=50421 RepID=UPI0025E5C48C|nr:diguanylate cyclase [Rhodoferax sp.]